MEKDYYFSSKKELDVLLPFVSQTLQNLGFDNDPLSKAIQGKGWNIQFSVTDFGCKGKVYLFEDDKNEFERLDGIIKGLIQYMVDSDRVWAVGFSKSRVKAGSKDLSKDKITQDKKVEADQALNKHWEKFTDEYSQNVVFLFLTTDVTLAELEKRFYKGNQDGKRISVDLANLRKVELFPSGLKGRKEYHLKWEKYLQQASDATRKKYQELTETLLPALE